MKVISLDSLLEASSEESDVFSYLSSFVCCENNDVESFLHNKAVDSEKRSLSRTSLVIDENNNNEIIGYFSLLIKNFDFTDVSGTTRKKLTGNSKTTSFTTILIGQLGRADSYKGIVDGKQILDLALETCNLVNLLVAIKVVCVEYVDTPKLCKFYEDNKFSPLQKNDNGCIISYVRL